MRSPELFRELDKHTVTQTYNINKLQMAEGEPLPWVKSAMLRDMQDALAAFITNATLKKIDHDSHVEYRAQIVVLPVERLHQLITAVASELKAEERFYAPVSYSVE